MLKGIQQNYENFHNVTYTDAAIRGAITLSVRYIADRFLPDKAIDLIDQAGAIAATKGQHVVVLMNVGRKSRDFSHGMDRPLQAR
ncbi:hypothetical protein BBP10_09125 [Limosilactobacillus reuteri]|nr:hypothetical protein BBP10_09125 [Limosilactobacillus reuteri]